MDVIRVACVGYGFGGRVFHAPLVKLVPQMRLRGVASRDPATRQRIVTEQGCLAYDSLETVLDDSQIDLVILATPHDLHAEQAIAALRAGKHVVTDKVMCLNLKQCDAMIAAARDSGKLLSVFHNRRWDGDFLTLQQVIHDGTLGKVNWIEMAWGRPGIPKRWRSQRSRGGGRLYDLGSHLLDQLLLLFPQPIESVYCGLHRDFPAAETDVESQALVILNFEGGQTAMCDISSVDYAPKPRIRARGMNATLTKTGVDPQEAALLRGDMVSLDSPREDPANAARISDGKTEQTIPTLPGRWRSFYENIADVLLHGAEPAVTLDQMRRLMAVYDAIWQSTSTGQSVRPVVRSSSSL